MNEIVTEEYVETIGDIKKWLNESLEVTTDDFGRLKYCYFSDHLYDTPEDAIEHIFEIDEEYQEIKHLKDNDNKKVIRRYDESGDLLPFLPYEEK